MTTVEVLTNRSWQPFVGRSLGEWNAERPPSQRGSLGDVRARFAAFGWSWRPPRGPHEQVAAWLDRGGAVPALCPSWVPGVYAAYAAAVGGAEAVAAAAALLPWVARVDACAASLVRRDAEGGGAPPRMRDWGSAAHGWDYAALAADVQRALQVDP